MLALLNVFTLLLLCLLWTDDVYSQQEQGRVNIFGKRKGRPHADFLDAHSHKQEGRGQQRVQEALRHHNGSIDVILLGDSILSHIQLNETVWNNFHRKYKAMNLGSPRDRIEHMHFRIDHVPELFDTKFVIVLAGNNNIEIKEKEKVVFESLVGIVERIFQVFNPNVRVLMNSFLPRYKNDAVNANLVAINNRLEQKYNGSKNVHYMDLYDRFLFKMSRQVNRDLFMPDNIHPNHFGYEKMIEMWRPYLDGTIAFDAPTPTDNVVGGDSGGTGGAASSGPTIGEAQARTLNVTTAMISEVV